MATGRWLRYLAVAMATTLMIERQKSLVDAALSRGDPVIETVGSPSNIYSFNGHGEYVFLKSDKGLEIQARLDYLVPGNNDSTIFTAIVLTDNQVNESIQLEFNRSSKHLSLYLDDGTLWKTTDTCTPGPPIRTSGFILICLRPPSKGFHIILILILNIGMDISTDGIFMNIKVTSRPALTNMTGLAGNVQEGYYVSQNGTRYKVNSNEHDMFDYGESWSVRNDPNTSLFNYNLTGGNFSYYNVFSKPRFLEDLLDNTTALFARCILVNATAIMAICKNTWDNMLDKACMFTMARTCNRSIAMAIHNEVEKQHENFMRRINMPPSFQSALVNSTILINKANNSWILNLTEAIWDENLNDLRFELAPMIMNEMKIDDGVFNWTIGTALRNISERTIRFIVYDTYNMSADHSVSLRYCGCDEPDQCRFRSDDDANAECTCPNRYATGTFCEIKTSPCDEYMCYDQPTCNHTEVNGNPCASCPRGFFEQMVGQTQHCLAESLLFGKLSYSVDTIIHINISRFQKDIPLQYPSISVGTLSSGNPLIDLLRQLGCSTGQ